MKSASLGFFLLILFSWVPRAHAILIYDNGVFQRTAHIQVRWSEEDSQAVEFVAEGPQAFVFASDPESGWECKTWIDWKAFDESKIRARLEGFEKLRAPFDKELREKRHLEAVKAARDEYARANEQCRCRFSFRPKVPINDVTAELLDAGARAVNAKFRNVWEDSELGKNTVSWGYAEFEGLLNGLAAREDRDDQGFWVRDEKHHRVFRCQDDAKQGRFPCWHSGS
jgi:hypothetical protein